MLISACTFPGGFILTPQSRPPPQTMLYKRANTHNSTRRVQECETPHRDGPKKPELTKNPVATAVSRPFRLAKSFSCSSMMRLILEISRPMTSMNV